MHGSLPPVLQAERPRSRRWLWITLAVVVVAAALGLWQRQRMRASAARPGAAAKATPPAVVTVVVPGATDVASQVRLTGSIAARRSDPIGVQGEGGMVSAVLVKEGDFVRRGQVLARIDRAVQTQQLAQMQAGIGTAEADSRLAQAELDRALALVARGFISKADIDRRTATRDSALARIRVARAQTGEMRARVARLDIRAPADGLILTRAVEAGQVVSAGGQALFTLAEGGAMELRGLAAEQDLARIRVGQRATVTVVGEGAAVRGRVWLIDPVIDAQARQGLVRVALGADRRLRPGAFANASVETGTTSVPQLPQSAVQSDENGNFVLVVGPDNRVAVRRIAVGAVGPAGLTVRSGLTGRERVVVNAAAFLQPGERVEPVAAAPVRR